MTTKLVRFQLEGGDSVLVLVDEEGAGPVPAAAHDDIATRAKMTFEQATAKLGPIARTVLAQVENLGQDETNVELGLKFSAEAGVILAKSAAEGTCKITIKWRKHG
jgi:hypothetical protein